MVRSVSAAVRPARAGRRCQEAAPDSGQTTALTQSVHDLEQQVNELRAAVTELRAQTAQYHAQTDHLQRQLAAYQAQSVPERSASVSTPQAADTATGYLPANTGAGTVEEEQTAAKHPASVEEQLQLLTAKVDDQYQTKVESASKYRLRLSGILLFNLFDNRGYMDSADIPHLVQERTPDQAKGSFGGTLRQSLIGLEVFGPKFAGARSRGDWSRRGGARGGPGKPAGRHPHGRVHAGAKRR